MTLKSLWGRVARLKKKQPKAPPGPRPISWDWLASRRPEGHDPEDVRRWTEQLYGRPARGPHPVELKIASAGKTDTTNDEETE